MSGGSRDGAFQAFFFCFVDAFGDFVDFVGQPHVGRRTLTVIGFGIHIDAAIFPQLFDLAEGLAVSFGINGKGRSAEFFDYRKGRHIAGPVGNINHIGESDAAQGIGHLGIDIDFRMLRHALINFKKSPCLSRIVDGIAHFTDDLMFFCIEPFNEVTAPDCFNIGMTADPLMIADMPVLTM